MKQIIGSVLVAGAIVGAVMTLARHPALAFFVALAPTGITLIRAIKRI